MFEAQTVIQQQTSYASDLYRPPGIAAINMWFCAAVLVAFTFTMNAKPAQHLPQKRQSPSSLNCTVSTDCYPPNFPLNATLPETYILCRSSECVCEQCFVPNQTSGRCQVDEPCQRYSVVNQQCVDDRRSQRTALLLSVFLSIAGVANFYIGRIEYAIPQLLLLVPLIAGVITSLYLRRFKDRDNVLVAVLSFVSAVTVVLVVLIILAWWIADVVIFAQNSRLDEDGCPLANDI